MVPPPPSALRGRVASWRSVVQGVMTQHRSANSA